MDAALKYALLALSAFRHRHDRVQRFKTGRRRHQLVPVNYREHAATARRYIRDARAAGFRGSIREQAMAIFGQAVTAQCGPSGQHGRKWGTP